MNAEKGGNPGRDTGGGNVPPMSPKRRWAAMQQRYPSLGEFGYISMMLSSSMHPRTQHRVLDCIEEQRVWEWRDPPGIGVTRFGRFEHACCVTFARRGRSAMYYVSQDERYRMEAAPAFVSEFNAEAA